MADAVPKPVRKLPFKPTALGRSRAAPRPSSSAESDGKGKGKQKATDSDEDDDLALFRRSREMAPRIAADRERRLAKAKRQKEGEEQRRAFYGEKRPLEEDGGSEHGTSQDRLASPTLGGVVDGIEGEGANEEAVGSTDAISELVTPPSSKRSRRSSSSKDTSFFTARGSARASQSPSIQRLRSNPPTPAKAASSSSIILLDSDDDEPSLPAPSQPEPADEEAEEEQLAIIDEPASSSALDGEFAEYVRRAEEQRERDRTSDNRAKVELVVTSEIEGSKPLCVLTYFDKPLNTIRAAWLSYQRRNNIHIPAPEDLILTWRQKRVYNYSTLRDLGLRPSGDVGAYTEGFSRKGLIRNGSVHMEIWSPELFRKWEAKEASRRHDSTDEHDNSQDALYHEEQEPEEEKAKLRVVLAAPGYNEVKLTVRLGTTVETLVTGFRAAQKSIPTEKDVSLWFDGEKMEEHVTMEEAEIDDMDKIEVHVR